ncbi:hypothetical protein CHS0354_035270 [Potamilus streckersoni]|uniref:Putative GTP diphosphokinase RSH1, chloroplastic n=1 Tax=Potamilus streckersoni TaxID=2493646 RepID=A0AAE0VNA4_9BIVA|nr:hypothetical protein CHS0354_035270 [Potamilus streckersoni]
MTASPQPYLIIISSPSGVGKTSVVNTALNSLPQFKRAITHTTRTPRAEETDGKDYYFTAKSDFEAKIRAHEFAEYATVYGNYYGTSKAEISRIIRNGYHCVLIIDVQGAASIRKLKEYRRYSIFFKAPDKETVIGRLKLRDTESDDVLRLRIAEYENEMEQAVLYDEIIINDDFERTAYGCYEDYPHGQNLQEHLQDNISLCEKLTAPHYKYSVSVAAEAVAILKSFNLDSRSLLCAVLHAFSYPVVKQHLIDKELISKETAGILKHLDTFNIANLTPNKTADSTEAGISPREHARSTSEKIRQLIHAGSIDPRLLFIKIAIADAYLREALKHNTPTARTYAEEVLEIYAPVAHRIGAYDFKNNAEDRAFRILYPSEYKQVEDFITQKTGAHNSEIAAISDELRALMDSHRISGEVSGRVKAPYSIYKKTIRKHLPLSKLYDILAFRIIVNNERECYELLSLLHNSYKPLDRFKDYISNPKPNGYRSLHTTVENARGSIFEIQLRDKTMHRESEMGVAAHWSYKEGAGTPEREKGIGWLRHLNETLNKTDNPESAVKLFEGELSSEHIYVFTPNGQIIRLPKGATVIDFAYAIHSEVGNRCTGGRIGDKIVSIRRTLNNGEQVEVLNTKNSVPTKDWLEFAVTPKAKQHIRVSLKQKETDDLREQGLKSLLKLLKKVGVRFSRPEETPEVKLLQKKRKKNSPEELYESIGREGISEDDLRISIETPETEIKKDDLLKTQSPLSVSDSKFMRVKDYTFIPVRFAKCCHPRSPASIFGLADGTQITAHLTDCAAVKSRRIDESQKIPLVWDIPQPKQNMQIELKYPADFRITIKIFKLLTSMETAFIETSVKQSRKELTQTLLLTIDDEKKINLICEKLRGIKQVNVILTRTTVADLS